MDAIKGSRTYAVEIDKLYPCLTQDEIVRMSDYLDFSTIHKRWMIYRTQKLDSALILAHREWFLK